MAIYSGFSHKKWWFSIATLNYQKVYELLSQMVDDSIACLDLKQLPV